MFALRRAVDAPARRMGCLIPNNSVIGVVMTDILTGKAIAQTKKSYKQ
jgi:hypothetical protein